MANKIECPYCEMLQEIDHATGEYYTEGKEYKINCKHCDKVLKFETFIEFENVQGVDCLNGLSEHGMVPVIQDPTIYPDWAMCKNCGLETRGELSQKAVDEFIYTLDKEEEHGYKA